MKRSSNPHDRRGLTTVAVLICFVVLGLMITALVKLGVAYRDQIRTAERRLQAEWLAEAGVDRALAKLSYDPDYKGETWEIPVDELGLPAVKDTEKGPAAVVKIEVEPAKGQDGGRILRVRADYPPDSPRRVRVSREVIAPKSS